MSRSGVSEVLRRHCSFVVILGGWLSVPLFILSSWLCHAAIRWNGNLKGSQKLRLKVWCIICQCGINSLDNAVEERTPKL